MGLNDIELPSSLIASLYARSLVMPEGAELQESSQLPTAVASPAPSSETPANQQWKFLGSNKKNILIIVDYPGVLHLPDEELNFLTKMLTACKLDLGDVAILNRHHYPAVAPKDLFSFFGSRIIFLFGVDPVSFGLPVSFPQYQVQAVAPSTYLYAPTLGEHLKDELLKSKLWVCLKRIFAL